MQEKNLFKSELNFWLELRPGIERPDQGDCILHAADTDLGGKSAHVLDIAAFVA